MGRVYVRVDPLERVLGRIEIAPSGCWEFQGVSRADGYGAVATGGKGSPKVLAHRLTYERMVGPIPDGFEVHHRCHNRSCCNPDHLEAIDGATHRQEHRPEVCLRGHEPNWRIKPNGQRDCMTCHRDRERARQRRLRQAAC